MAENEIALIDLDATAADYDKSMQYHMRLIQSPEEPLYTGRYGEGKEPAHMETRRKLIQRQPGFWRELTTIQGGFEVMEDLKNIGFELHVLTKGPYTTPGAWGEKLEWCREHLPSVNVTVTCDKSLVYGRVLVDDFPPYFTEWIKVRPRGLVVCIAHPWNLEYASGGPKWQRNIFRYDGTNRALLRNLLNRAYTRKSGQDLF